jgi:lysophospholipase L1-like esterase
MRRVLSASILLVTATLLSLALAELVFVGFSIEHPELTTEALWGGDQDESARYQRVTRVGGIGFRQPPLDPGVLEGDEVTRVLFLGDSFTEGSGVAIEDRFTNLVEARLNEELVGAGSTERIHSFNAGRGGSNPLQWLEYYRALEPYYRPAVVVAVFFLRDGAPLPTSLLMNQRTIDPIREKYRALPLYEASALLRFFYHRLAWKEYGEAFQRKVESSYLGSMQQRKAWSRRSQALAEIAADCRREGIPFHLVIFPFLFDLKDYDFFGVEQEITRFASDHGIPVYSLTPGFLGEDEESLWVASNDQHPNEKGHRIAADTLLPYLRTVLRGPPVHADPR